MRHTMRRSERALSEAETLRILEGGEYGVLSTCGADGLPYGCPQLRLERGPHLFPLRRGGPQTGEPRPQRAGLVFCVVGDTHPLADVFSTLFESAIVFGEACECRDEAEKLAALKLLVDKYAPENTANGYNYAQRALGKVRVFCMDAAKVTGKARRK